MTLTRVNTNGITDGTIVDADVSGSAAIAGTKVSPDFGSQNRTSTGTSTAASFIPTGSSVPANGVYLPGANALGLSTNSTERIRVTSGGLVGIGTTSPNAALDVLTGVNAGVVIRQKSSSPWNSGEYTQIGLGVTGANAIIRCEQTDSSAGSFATALTFFTTNTSNALSERCRLTSSGQFLVGTSTARSNTFSGSVSQTFQIEGNTDTGRGAAIFSTVNGQPGGYLLLGHSKDGTIGGNALITNGDDLGLISFQGNDGSKFVEGARISAIVDGTSGVSDLPTRLSFSTTKDGQASPSEAMRINQAGTVWIGNGGNARSTGGAEIHPAGYIYTNVDSNVAAYFNRINNDGTIVELRQDNVTEGTISVSGTTVSYNGAHLSRWSQLPGGAEREEILRGTVLSNIDEMCAWGEEDNEQLNRMQVSDIEGDPNVAGVFQSWDDDDDTYTDDFYCAMTGDFIIRIAEGVTVQRGDLLMSAGDGTAKPQDDDIIRSKTVAKVTSTHVTCTYDDGSYCVPCVLMAC
jgi:hypothetical protein